MASDVELLLKLQANRTFLATKIYVYFRHIGKPHSLFEFSTLVCCICFQYFVMCLYILDIHPQEDEKNHRTCFSKEMKKILLK